MIFLFWNGTGRERQFFRFCYYYVRGHRKLFFIAALLCVGVLMGCLAAVDADGQENGTVAAVLQSYLQSRRTQTLYQTFLYALLPSAAVLGVIFLCGFCAVAQPILLLFPLSKGLAFGLITRILLEDFSAQSLRYFFLYLLPHMAATSFLLILACNLAWRFCDFCFRNMIGRAGQENVSLTQYIAGFLAFFCCDLVCACINAGLAALFC